MCILFIPGGCKNLENKDDSNKQLHGYNDCKKTLLINKSARSTTDKTKVS